MNRVLCLTNMTFYIIWSKVFVAVEKFRRVLSDLIPVKSYRLFAIVCSDAKANTFTVVVNETHITVSAMTAYTVFLFQKVCKFLFVRLIPAIEIINTELTIRKATSSHNLITECFNGVCI